MSFIKLTIVLLIACITFYAPCVQCKSTVYGVGDRVIGDQLLLKDVLQSRPSSIGENPTINFNYAVPEAVTYIEITSEQNIRADVNFSYEDNLIKGNVTAIDTNSAAINTTDDDDDDDAVAATTESAIIADATTAQPTFEILVTIYGLNESTIEVDPSFILNRRGVSQSAMKFQPVQREEPLVDELFDDEDIYLNSNEEGVYDDDDDITESDNNVGGDNDAEVFDDGEFDQADKIIELGDRQKGDYLIYDTYQTSSASTEEPTNHSVVFYYIDSNFITYVRFVVFDHFVHKAKNDDDYNPPIAEYSHFSPNTLKAVISDDQTTSLFVQMHLYGYRPADLPVDYVPFMSTIGGGDSGGGGQYLIELPPMSPMQRLRARLHAMSGATTATTTEGAIAAELAEELTIHATSAMPSDHKNPPNNSASTVTNLSIAMWFAMITFSFGVMARGQI